MTARLTCLVPGCRRTREAHPIWDEWICARHWALVPRLKRRALTRARRRNQGLVHHHLVEQRLWRRCKTIAIAENFMGFAP